MHSPPATIAPEIIACIAEERQPTINELRRVAERIGSELRGSQSVFRWDHPEPERAERRLVLRAALAALAGDRDAVDMSVPIEA